MKKIVTVSVLAIMAVSAANADIASTTYVDKAKTAVEGQISDLSGVVATKAAQADLTDLGTRVSTAEGKITDNTTEIGKKAAQTVVDALSGKVGDVSLSGTNYMKDDTNLTAAVKSLDTQLSNVAGGNLAIKADSITTTEIKDGTITIDDFGQDLTSDVEVWDNTTDMVMGWHKGETSVPKATADAAGNVITTTYATKSELPTVNNAALTIKVNGEQKGQFTANSATAADVDIAVPTAVSQLTNDSKFQTESQVTSAINTATTDMATNAGVTATLNNYYTKDAADAEFYNAGEVTSAIEAAVGEGGAVKNVIDGALANYSTTAQMNGALNEKIDKASESSLNVATAVKATQDASGNVITATYATKNDLTEGLNKKLDDTATGSATLPIYIDDKGVAQTITSYSGNAATATTASDYASTGTIKTKFDGVDTSLAKVAAFGEVPAVPAKCAEVDNEGNKTADCTLVMKYNNGVITPSWEVIAR